VTGLIDRVLGQPGWLVLLIAGAVVFAEDALFVGFVLPGETVAVLAGASAKLGHVSLAAVLAVVIVAAIVGDTVGYEIGRRAGDRVLRLRFLAERGERLDAARSFLARRGGSAVLLGRWVAFFRAVMPALAGTARMPYARFLVWNALGGIVWGAAVVLIGYAAGASYARVEKSVGRDAGYVVAGLLLLALVVTLVRRRRAHRGAGA
jgi:membrane-associated protein